MARVLRAQREWLNEARVLQRQTSRTGSQIERPDLALRTIVTSQVRWPQTQVSLPRRVKLPMSQLIRVRATSPLGAAAGPLQCRLLPCELWYGRDVRHRRVRAGGNSHHHERPRTNPQTKSNMELHWRQRRHPGQATDAKDLQQKRNEK